VGERNIKIEIPDNADRSNLRRIEFNGAASAYFGIWISNSVLSIITLGIYSAWAKVRRKQFFLNHTIIDEFPFAYHATGWQLLIGRIIVFVVILAYSTVSAFVPLVSIAVLPIFVLCLAWVLNRSLRFNAKMTSWRNVRFNWHGTYWKTLFFFLVGPALGIASAGILIPLFSRYYYQYYADNFSFGTERFSASTKIGSFYAAFGLTLLITGGLVALAVFATVMMSVTTLHSGSIDNLVVLLISLGVAAYLILVYFIYAVMCRNMLVRTLKLGDAVSFGSSLSPARLCWITVSNFFAIILSLGLLYPWTVVRLYRYLAQNTWYDIHTDVDHFIDKEQEKMGAFGEEFADLEGFDVSI